MLKEKLRKDIEAVDKSPHDSSLQKEAAKSLNEYVAATSDEMKKLQQKAKIQWLKDGDRNTAYFYEILKSRKSKSRLESISNEEGIRYEGDVEPEQFEDANVMVRLVSDKEIKEFIFDIDSMKEFFRNGKLLGEVNATLIALIPKFFVFLNGEVHGYFKGGRGLRQGDPISPYLFTLVLEVFNVIMCRNIKESEDAKEIKNLNVVKKSLDKFNQTSELIPIWRNKVLSYAGRIQPIASVLAFMQLYWTSVYLLPSSIVNDLDKLFKRKRWNEVLLIRQFWKILESKNSLWEKWVNVVKLKKLGVYGILLLIKWGWKTMMRIRDIIKDDVTYKIGSGLKTSMWFDKWCPNGPMCDVILKRTLYEARIKDSVMVNGYGQMDG
ncbi:hypothetical protein Tco_0245564 [Tanacetum coccineum]